MHYDQIMIYCSFNIEHSKILRIKFLLVVCTTRMTCQVSTNRAYKIYRTIQIYILRELNNSFI